MIVLRVSLGIRCGLEVDSISLVFSPSFNVFRSLNQHDIRTVIGSVILF